MTVLYHRTTAKSAEAILADGFKDGTGPYLTDQSWTGVWLSDRPLDPNEGAEGDTVLRVTLRLSETQIAEYEWVEEGKPYREFLIPATSVNAHATVAIEPDDSMGEGYPDEEAYPAPPEE